MTISEYFEILGLPVNSSADEIRKAYRVKARQYHPDINHSPDAKDMFIRATEAYEFLIANYERLKYSDEEYQRVMEEWRKYRQNRTRQRAHVYARASYSQFKNTRFYKTTRIFDASIIVFSLIISVILNFYIVLGYIYRIRHPLPDSENPTFFTFILIELFGMMFLIISLIYMKAYLETSRKQRKGC